MKKFLFTLLTLFMASSAFAEGGNYFYMDNFTVVKTKLGEVKVKADVKGHFANYVSAWQCDLGYVNENGEEVMNALPEGITKVTSVAGTDMQNLPYTGDDGEDYDDYTPNIKKGMNGTRLIVAADQGNYSPDGELYGCVKWAPDDYDQMMVLTFTCSKDFTGAKLILKTLPSCGDDTRTEIHENLAPTVWATSPVCIVDVKYIAPEPVFTWNETTYTMDAAVPEGYNADDYKIVMYANGVEVEFPYTVEQTTDEQTIVFTAYTQHADDETYDSNDAIYGKTTTMTVTVPAKEQLKDLNGTIKLGDVTDDGKVTVTYTPGEGDPENVELAVVVKDKDGKVVENAYADGVITLPDYGEYTVTVTASATGYNDKTFDPETVKWEKKAFEGTADVTFNGNIATLTYTSNDPDATVEVKVGETATTVTWTYDEATKTYTATYEVEETATEPGEHSVTVTLTVTPSDNYTGDAVSDSDTYTYKVNDELKGDIELGDVTDDGKVTVTYTPGEGDPENVELAVVVKDKDGNVVENAYADGVITLPDYGEYTVEVTAKADDYNDKPFDPETVKWEKKDAQKPTIAGANLTDATYDIVITPDPNTDGTLEYTATPMGAVVRAGATTIRYERQDAAYTVHVEANTTEGATYKKSETAVADIVIPAKPAPEVIELPDPTISETHDAANQTTIITITVPENTPEGTVLNYTLTDEDGNVIPASDYTVTATDGKIVITIPNGAETAFVTVTATTTMPNAPEGVVVKNGEAEKNVEIPQYQQTAAPTIDVSFGGEDGAHYANVTFVNNDAKPATIEYSLDNGKTWNTYTPGVPVVINTYGETTVLARATAEGKATSEVAERSFMLNDDATSVNELVNGKTVAGVRYFNMAGQEMQEANGITIVVTTYTDGTTSAVKVIK